MKALKLSLSLLIIAVFAGCSNNSPEDLQDNAIADVVTYQNTIKEIMTTNCVSCHGAVPSGGAPMSLNTYATVKASVLSMGTINRITRNLGDGLLMPQNGPKLPQAKIDAIIKWQTQGFQD